MHIFTAFDSFSPLNEEIPSGPLTFLPDIASRARAGLSHLTDYKIRIIELRIIMLYNRYIGLEIQSEVEKLKEQLGDSEEVQNMFEWVGGINDGRWRLKLEKYDLLPIHYLVHHLELNVLNRDLDIRDDVGAIGRYPGCNPFPEGTHKEFFYVLSLHYLALSVFFLKSSEPRLNHAAFFAAKALEALANGDFRDSMESTYLKLKSQHESELRELRSTHNTQLADGFFKGAANEWKIQAEKRSARAKKAGEAQHSKKNGNWEKHEQIKAKWASGNYESRDLCCEAEALSLGMSFHAARKALRNTPDPDKKKG